MSKTYIDFQKDLERINDQLEKKHSELTTAQKSFNDFKAEVDHMVVKQGRIGGRFNIKLKREIEDSTVKLNKLRADVQVADAEIKRLQGERDKIRSMMEINNVSSKKVDATVNGGKSIGGSDRDKLIRAKMIDKFSNED